MFTFHFSVPSKALSAEGSSSRSVNRGEIYIETENGFFPCIGWGDRLLSVLIQWISNAIKIVDSTDGKQNVENHFMNGPYFFVLQKEENDCIFIHFIRSIGELEKIEELPLLHISLIDYCNVLLGLAERVVDDPHFLWFGKEQERIYFQQSVLLLRERL